MILKKFILKKFFSKIKDHNNLSFFDLSNKKLNYSQSFFEEYKKYPKIQLDSFNKLNLNEQRFYNNIQCFKKDLYNKNVLEVGSGSGKFTEILIDAKCNLVTTDINDSVLINYKNNFNNKLLNKIYFIKNDVNQTIFNDAVFDFVILYGVLQNVDDQKGIIKDYITKLKTGGKLTIDVTKAGKFYTHLLNPKFFWRNFFKRINPAKTFLIVNFLIPKFIKLDTFLKKNFGIIGRIFSKIIFPFPLINYFFLPLDDEIRLKMSILDTFDALASKYDRPLTKKELELIIFGIEKELKTNFKKVDVFEKDKLIVANIIR
jgi:ubiquinone/menaquinone biosynthesis C-methylase UbiE